MVLTNLNINLVSAQYNGNVLANTLKIAVPIWHILVGDSRSDIEHDDAALALDVISIAKTTKLFLSSGIPDIETDRAEISGKGKWVDFDTESGYTKKGQQELNYHSCSAIVRSHDLPMYFFSNSPVRWR
jgi:hypothetical protein